jgi:hypothetical protein
LLHRKIKRPCTVIPWGLLPGSGLKSLFGEWPQTAARRIHVKNAALATIDVANSADDIKSANRADRAASVAKNTAPIAATPAALAIWVVVPYIPAPEPALAGFTVESTALDNGAITSPWP